MYESDSEIAANTTIVMTAGTKKLNFAKTTITESDNCKDCSGPVKTLTWTDAPIVDLDGNKMSYSEGFGGKRITFNNDR